MADKTDTVRKLFGTDGIRGVANQDPMTAEMALRLGQAVAQRFRHPARPPSASTTSPRCATSFAWPKP